MIGSAAQTSWLHLLFHQHPLKHYFFVRSWKSSSAWPMEQTGNINLHVIGYYWEPSSVVPYNNCSNITASLVLFNFADIFESSQYCTRFSWKFGGKEICASSFSMCLKHLDVSVQRPCVPCNGNLCNKQMPNPWDPHRSGFFLSHGLHMYELSFWLASSCDWLPCFAPAVSLAFPIYLS